MESCGHMGLGFVACVCIVGVCVSGMCIYSMQHTYVFYVYGVSM